MSITKKIVYKGQCIEVISEKSQGGGSHYKYRIKYFPKEYDSSCAWRMLQCQTKFTQRDEAIKEAKIRIDAELENGNWTRPTQKMFKDCEYEG